MKTFTAVLCFTVLLAGAFQTTSAIRSSDLVDAVLEQQNENGLVHSIISALGVKDEALEAENAERNAYALVKYVIVPTKAKGFIEEFEAAKKAAEKADGYITYNLVKTLDDNISYYAWAAWESRADLAKYLKSDSALKLLEYTAKEDIVTLLTGVIPIA